MIRLDTTTRKLQAVLGGAVATTQPDATVCYADKTASAYTGGAAVAALNGTLAVDICPAPPASTVRDVDTIIIRNNDTATVTLTVRYSDNATLYKLIVVSLLTGESLWYTHAAGWSVLDASGNLKMMIAPAALVSLTTGVTGVLPVSSGGTGIAFFTPAGPTAARTYTFPDVDMSVGYLHIPQNSQSAAYTLVLGDAGKHLLHPAGDNIARTVTIPANASVAFPVGTTITFINEVNTLTIAITSDTLVWAQDSSTGSRTLAAMGLATAIKKTTTSWLISGTGLS